MVLLIYDLIYNLYKVVVAISFVTFYRLFSLEVFNKTVIASEASKACKTGQVFQPVQAWQVGTGGPVRVHCTAVI